MVVSRLRTISLVTALLLLSSGALADSVVGTGTFQNGWTASTNGSTYFSNTSWDGANMNIGFCLAGGGNCNFAGSPGSALPVYAGSGFASPGAFYMTPDGDGSYSALMLEVAGLSNTNEFGWYLIGTDPTNSANRNALFVGPQGAGAVTTFNPSGAYGFYILAGGSTLYTSSLFGGATDQNFAIFQQGNGTYWLGIEDLPLANGDRDYNDMIVKVSPVPESGSLLMLGLGGLVLAMAIRHKMSQPQMVSR
jgi:hypothetical protein